MIYKEKMFSKLLLMVETSAESSIDWTLLAIGATAGVITLVPILKMPPFDPAAKQKQEMPTQAPLAQTFYPFYMQWFKRKDAYGHTKKCRLSHLSHYLSLTISNTAYYAAIVRGLAVAYGRLGHMVMKNIPPPQLEKVNSGAASDVVCIGAALLNKDFLVTSGIIPRVLLK